MEPKQADEPQASEPHPAAWHAQRRERFNVRTALLCAFIFLTAAGVRLMYLQDNQSGTPLAGMEAAEPARSILAGNVGTFLRGTNPPNNASVLIRPPGYTF